ncbi:hypothetical protein [Nocardia sp. NPDC048505]|uniref:hypothetical protein n=1 Tax=unclassified Nocardia TaxID=2637762 RepID=UPI00340ED58D
MSDKPEVVFDVARGDLGLSRSLKASLEILRSATPDPAIRKQIEEVLAGRASMREFGLSDAFAKVLDGVPKQVFDQAASMSEEERARLAAQGEAELERLRNLEPESATATAPAEPPPAPGPAVTPGTRKPNRDRVVTRDEPDDDDLYFQERRDRGWLE